MNIPVRTLILAGATAVLTAGCAGHGGGPMGSGMHGRGMMAATGSGSHLMQQRMMGRMQQMQGMRLTGDMDVDFVRMMRQHHLQGIDMARMQLQGGDDPEARQMAQKIIEQQTREVAEFDRWLQRQQ